MRYEKLKLEEFPPRQKLRLLQNAVGEVTALAYVKRIGDLDVACGNTPLSFESYLELLLSACSEYDKKITLPGKQKRAVYATSIVDDDIDPYSYEGSNDGEYEVINVDTDVHDIMVHATDTNRFGNNRFGSKTAPGNQQTKFLPREEWNKLTQEQKDQLIAKRRQERMGNGNDECKTFHAPRQVNVHKINNAVNLDNLIDYVVMNHNTGVAEDDNPDPKEDTSSEDTLLAYMAGRSSDASGDIRQVLAAKRPHPKGKARKVNESQSTPSTVQVGDSTYYLNKGETITFQGQTYSAHATAIHYRVGQHSVTLKDKALVDRGANGGICGVTCWY